MGCNCDSCDGSGPWLGGPVGADPGAVPGPPLGGGHFGAPAFARGEGGGLGGGEPPIILGGGDCDCTEVEWTVPGPEIYSTCPNGGVVTCHTFTHYSRKVSPPGCPTTCESEPIVRGDTEVDCDDCPDHGLNVPPPGTKPEARIRPDWYV